MSDDGRTKLQQVIGLFYQMQPEDVDALEASLLEQEKRAWRTALAEKAQQYAGRRLAPRDPSGADLRQLREWARRDAESVARTYNREVGRQIQRLFEANPRGNRVYYAKHMEAWAQARGAKHMPMVALNTVQQTREYAKERFRAMNGLRPRGFVLAGPPPVCEECNEAQAAGVVDESYIHRHPMPAHFRCAHEWEEVPGARAPALRDLWLG